MFNHTTQTSTTTHRPHRPCTTPTLDTRQLFPFRTSCNIDASVLDGRVQSDFVVPGAIRHRQRTCSSTRRYDTAVNENVEETSTSTSRTSASSTGLLHRGSTDRQTTPATSCIAQAVAVASSVVSPTSSTPTQLHGELARLVRHPCHHWDSQHLHFGQTPCAVDRLHQGITSTPQEQI